MGSACCGTAKVEPLNPAESLPSDWSPLVAHAFFSHEGGAGGLGKENQDVVFVAQPSAEIGIFGVLDGHGKEHGRLAAQVGAAAPYEIPCAIVVTWRWSGTVAVSAEAQQGACERCGGFLRLRRRTRGGFAK